MGLTANRETSFVKKQIFEIPSLELASGQLLRGVRIGFETHGTLNEAKDNAILITHYFTGTSHCAGRYTAADLEPGYWDSIIGPGRAIDTNRFFVISADSLCNLNTLDANVITTGPASIEAETGKPYGMRFPLVTIRDFVETQKRLVESLGIQKLHAVCGPSMGAMQALEWAAAYPTMVPRVVAAIPGTLDSDPYLIAKLSLWMTPIMNDPAWNKGDYYDGPRPMRGLVDSLMRITIEALHTEWARRTFGRRSDTTQLDPSAAFENRFAIEAGLEEVAKNRARIADANSLLYLAKAVQTYSLKPRISMIRAQILLLPAESDLLLFPEYATQTARELESAGINVKSVVLKGGGGHLDGLHNIAQAAHDINAFLTSGRASLAAGAEF